GSYPAAPLHDFLKSGYQNVGASSPITHPTPEVVSAAFPEVQALFDPAPLEFLDDPSLSDSEKRARIARALFRPNVEEPLSARLDKLADLARHESEQPLATGAP